MAIDTIPYRDADNLAHAQRGFYAAKIPVSHWQLRHYISAPEPDLLYYASARDIYCLNTATKKRKHIATLPFEARCTASGYGYICVGGEDDGHFAAIKIDGNGARQQDTDTASEPRRHSVGRRAASIKVERIGDEIVNSISIHRIQDEEAHLDDIVAVLTNNDKTVRMYSLPQSLETTVLDLPFAMNHATISPDGHMLIAVGDFNQAYFFQRDLQEVPPQIPKPHNRLTSSSIEWTLTSVVNLHASESSSGYFTTAWSETGHLVAVGSEGGHVTVFDMALLTHPHYEDEDAVVAVIPGSRPELLSYPGAVRTIIFAPDPWDLLIWAEDQGRVCIGDLRTGLKTKQVVNLDPKDEKLNKLVFEDVPAELRGIDELEADFERRHRNSSSNASAVNFATEYIEARRRQRQQRQDMAGLRSVANSAGVNALEDDPHGLTIREQEILESLRTTRQREEARSNGRHIPRSVNYTNADMFTGAGGLSRTTLPRAHDSALTTEALAPVPDSFPELSRTSGTSRTASQRHTGQTQVLPSLEDMQYMPHGRRSTTTRTADAPSRLPRRRASVVMPPPSTSTAASRTAPQAAVPSTGAEDFDNPWTTIEAHMTLARGPLFESAARAEAAEPVPAISSSPSTLERELAIELAAEQARQRTLARQRERYRALRAEATTANAAAASTTSTSATDSLHQRILASTSDQVRALAGFPEGYETLLRRSQMQGNAAMVGRTGREVGVRTAGLALTDDGRTLWVASEEGIFEVPINLKGRMFWPSIEPR
ncbi:hypothetical protein LTR17_012704 [Elasticomyces elasticus]|nr:hypothetical protein LTR17_012704 [Elasticomyces elasticus]